MIQIEKRYNIALWLDKWFIEDFGLDPTLALYLKLLTLIFVLFIISFLSWYLTKIVIVRFVHKIFLKTKVVWDDVLIEKKVFEKIAYLVPAFIIVLVAPYIFGDFPTAIEYVIILSNIFIIIVIIRSAIILLSVFDEIVSNTLILKDKPITSYIQVLKIVVYFIGGILVLSLLLGKSPFYFLGAMGAMTAILLLIFKDTILGFVASIQMSVYDMARVGDWISMPKYDADGDVMSINLNTVKVQNWDKTITTIPTYAFITDSFKNWRGMSDSGGRRIKRAIYLKVSSFQFCDEKMLSQFKKYKLIQDYITTKENDVQKFNSEIIDNEIVSVNIRRLTNIGVFRIYAEKYITAHPDINKDMIIMVRQLEATSKGLPLEIYCFSSQKEWLKYETIISDIFDHLLTITSEFELEVFEEPTGNDFRNFNR
ncbi:mechanosensitive ion channel [Flavobacterium sp. LB2P84]|jgi:miniconductance mechanosensitive channel|uniref:mechanosensitive ion channel family protein n=1 Tax=Flavobacterium yafengii TaxID=3041253 RepID=UPI0024A8FCB4|nr:mechanosensitive ion channel domain-containing protein [Flavobacterium yafengii]MDI6034365.1 mechanosensitive ion channel [Flavobacterium yafengii]